MRGEVDRHGYGCEDHDEDESGEQPVAGEAASVLARQDEPADRSWVRVLQRLRGVIPLADNADSRSLQWLEQLGWEEPQ